MEEELEDSMFETIKELLKYVVFAITDIETFQPRPKRVTCVSRVYRLLAVKSTTPTELFSRKVSLLLRLPWGCTRELCIPYILSAD